MTLFDNISRDYKGPALDSEDTFAFLNRSASQGSTRVREMLEGWYETWPRREQQHLRRRFRKEFHSAFFELYIHQWLSLIGARAYPHPELPNTEKKPDFLAHFPESGKVYLEAVVATDESDTSAKESRVLAKLCDEVNKLDSPNFFIGLHRIRNPSNRQPSARKLRNFLTQKLRLLDPDCVETEIEASTEGRVPPLVFRDGDIEIEVDVIPKSRETRGKAEIRPIGVYPGELRWGGTSPAIKAALKRKASRYGKLPDPYVIAVNVTSKWDFDRRDVVEALFGTECGKLAGLSKELLLTENADGLWFGARGPRNTRVSAVITTFVLPWNLPRARMCIYHNPFARFRATQFPWQCDTMTVRLCWDKGVPPGKLLNLRANWPGKLVERHD